MSELVDAVEVAADQADAATERLRVAIVKAVANGHSYRQVASAARADASDRRRHRAGAHRPRRHDAGIGRLGDDLSWCYWRIDRRSSWYPSVARAGGPTPDM